VETSEEKEKLLPGERREDFCGKGKHKEPKKCHFDMLSLNGLVM